MSSDQNIPQWNKDKVWENVAAELQQKKKRRLLIWWFSGLGFLFVLVAIIVTTNDTVQTESSSQVLINKENDLQAAAAASAKVIASKVNKKTEENLEGLPSKKKTTQVEANQAQDIDPKAKSIETKKLKNSQLKKSLSSGKKKESNDYQLTSTKSDKPVKYSAESQTQIVDFIKLESDTIANHPQNFQASLALLTPNSINIQYERQYIALARRLNYINPQNSLSQNNSKMWWIETGLSFGNRLNPEISEDEVIRNNASEEFRFMHITTVGVQKYLNRNWSIKAGLSYQTVYEKYDYKATQIDQGEVFHETGIIYELPDGTNYFEAGYAIQETEKTRHIIKNNFTHRLSMPLELIYGFRKNNWSIDPSFGLRFQYLEQFDGVINDGNAHVMDQELINTRYYSNDFKIGLITSLNLKYQVTPVSSLGLGLVYEKDQFLQLPKDIVSPTYETFGIRVGYYRSF